MSAQLTTQSIPFGIVVTRVHEKTPVHQPPAPVSRWEYAFGQKLTRVFLKLELERFSLTSLRLPSNGTARVLPKKVHFHTIPVSRVTLSDFSSQDSPRCVRRKVNTRFLCRTSCLYFFRGGYWPKYPLERCWNRFCTWSVPCLCYV